MNDKAPSIIRSILLNIFGNAFLKFEGRAQLIEQRFLTRLNIHVAGDSLDEAEAKLTTLGAAATENPSEENQKALAEQKEQVEALQAAHQRHNIMLENLDYKKELLNRI